MSMNTDAIVGSMTSAEALTMATKCIAKLDTEQLAILHTASEPVPEEETDEDETDEKEL